MLSITHNMVKNVSYSIILFILYILTLYGFEELFKFIILEHDSIRNNKYIYMFIDTFIYLIIIPVTIIIKKNTNKSSLLKTITKTRVILLTISLSILYRFLADPIFRIQMILGNSDSFLEVV